MEETYKPSVVESRWQKTWDDNEVFRVSEDPDKPKFYVLEMFPYPSGKLHMGHVRNYSIGDALARYKRMTGHNVLHPMGWDAFGLPAENAAIENKTHPAVWTYANIEAMRKQFKRLGFSYDWSREIATCHPKYYRWEQKMFLDMLKKGLAYKKTSLVNWCPHDQTVLANEQVENGCCWRCGTEVVQQELDQWFLKITDYAEELLTGHDELGGWPEPVLTMQKNWIGKSYGSEIQFELEGLDDSITVFTTRPDTLFGATFMSVAPEHPLMKRLCAGKDNEGEVLAFVDRIAKQDKFKRTADDMEKEGIFTGGYAVNPANGRRIPIYAANFVLYEYGTGAVMAVPAHDQRDFEFATKYGIEKVVVIQPNGDALDASTMDCAYTDAGTMVNSGPFDGTPNEEGKAKVTEWLAERSVGKQTINYRLRDWGISRQRFWGCPVPVIYCQDCGTVPVPDEDLPVVLPEDVVITGQDGSPLAHVDKFVNCTCPQCGKPAKRDTDTFDTFVESSWYMLRYCSPRFEEGPVDPDKVKYWMPVDQYIGGIEHAVMHLIYFRFWNKIMRDLGYITGDEPAKNLLTQGMVTLETYRTEDGTWLYPEEVKKTPDGVFHLESGKPAQVGRVEKMSKSKHNVVEPNPLIERLGADTVRLFSLFAAPPDKDCQWDDESVEGCHRFLNRFWKLVQRNADLFGKAPTLNVAKLGKEAKALRRKTHLMSQRATDDIERRFQYNTAIAAMMELLNDAQSFKPKSEQDQAVLVETLTMMVKLLSPMAPHICEELWQSTGHEGMLLDQAWPDVDESALQAESIHVGVQVNGKIRAELELPADSTDDQLEQAAKENEAVQRHLTKPIRKVIVIRRGDRNLVNIVAK